MIYIAHILQIELYGCNLQMSAPFMGERWTDNQTPCCVGAHPLSQPEAHNADERLAGWQCQNTHVRQRLPHGF